MSKIISDLLKNLHEYDQRRRVDIIKEQGSKKIEEAKDKIPFYEFKGECEERSRIVMFLIEKDALKERDDFYYAATIIVNVGKLDNFITAYKLIKRYRELGGNKPWGFYDNYFAMQNWGMSKEEIFLKIEKQIGIHPSKLDKYD